MDKILKIDTVEILNKLIGQPTSHPMLCVIDDPSGLLSGRCSSVICGFYTVAFRPTRCGDSRYGRKCCDFAESTLTFYAPGQLLPMDRIEVLLAFQPDCFSDTILDLKRYEYTFFHYKENESLHISGQEKRILLSRLNDMREELRYDADLYSARIFAEYICLFLDYCQRFYMRQFIVRENLNKDKLSLFELALNDHFETEYPRCGCMPSARGLALKLDLSLDYLNDLLRAETGMSISEHIKIMLIAITKKRISENGATACCPPKNCVS